MKFWLYYVAGLVLAIFLLFIMPALMSAKSDLAVGAGVAFGAVMVGFIGHVIYNLIQKK
jgi:hypothetical protein